MTDASTILLPSRSSGIPLHLVTERDWPSTRKKLPKAAQRWAESQDFSARAGQILTVPGADHSIDIALAGLSSSADADPFGPGKLSRSLPPGSYRIQGDGFDPRLLALAWCLDAYSFTAYGKSKTRPAKLVCPDGVDRAEVLRAVEAAQMVRDLVNTPASDLGPEELEMAARAVAKRFRAALKVTKGRQLEQGFPMIHAVGKASSRAPRLIDFTWGNPRAPKVTLVGKGVCFDTGGLDIKPASGMLLMKKDMGGAANVLGLAHMIMAAKLPVRLRVLIPAVENAISGNAFRPGDVLKSRKGITVEIGNTDAEGRLVLADALAFADEEKPDLLVDMATLTGAARVALGPDLPPFYTDDDHVAGALSDAARFENDPLWRMPLWRPYHRLIESHVGDINNSSETGFAGSITAALFLRRFVDQAKTHVHFDIFGWVPSARPGHPRGGEAQGIRALFTMIRQRYS